MSWYGISGRKGWGRTIVLGLDKPGARINICSHEKCSFNLAYDPKQLDKVSEILLHEVKLKA